MLNMGETQSGNVSGFTPTVGRIVHVEQPTDPPVCLAAIVTGLDYDPHVAYLRVFDRESLAEWPDTVRLGSSTDRARLHDPRMCPRLTERPA
jgi:hypothetical protein